jgi:hypothetical protein
MLSDGTPIDADMIIVGGVAPRTNSPESGLSASFEL